MPLYSFGTPLPPEAAIFFTDEKKRPSVSTHYEYSTTTGSNVVCTVTFGLEGAVFTPGCFGLWARSQEADTVKAALDACADPEAPVLERACVEELLTTPCGAPLLLRRVAFASPTVVHPPAPPFPQGHTWRAYTGVGFVPASQASSPLNSGAKPLALLLTHSYRPVLHPARIGALTVRSLLVFDLVMFGEGAPFAAAVEALCAPVAAGGRAGAPFAADGCGGVWSAAFLHGEPLSQEKVSSLPPQTRAALRAARAAQLADALRSCIDNDWLGGFLALRSTRVSSLPWAAGRLERAANALAARLERIVGGGAAQEHTLQSLYARLREAEALERCGCEASGEEGRALYLRAAAVRRVMVLQLPSSY